jgi:general secretion pathway protein C
MSARWMTVVVWALAAAAAVSWGLRVFVQPAPVPAGALVADATPLLQADLTRLLGADPPPASTAAPEAAAPPPSARFALLGVVAPRSATGQARSTREGVALIAVDDRPARAFRVGARIEGDTVLQSVSARGAELGPRGGPVQVALQLPPLPAAATGTLPAAAPAEASPPAPVLQRPGMNRTPQNLPGSPPQPVVGPRPSPGDDGPAPAEKAPPHKGGPTLR